MPKEPLDNLVRINQLKPEPPDKTEFTGMLESARTRLEDAKLEGLSPNSQFSLAYSAAHTLALAALRWHGYRSTNRYLVFQCLEHTLGLEKSRWRVLDHCHKLRNIAEYEGRLDATPQLISELIQISEELLHLTERLGEIGLG